MNKVKLKDIAESQTGPFGSQLHEKDYVEVGTPIVTVEHLGEIGFFHQNLPFVSDEDVKRLSKYKLKKGDIVFSRVGSVDRNTYVSEKENGWLFSGRCIRVRVDEQKASSKFISFYFRQRNFKEMMLNISVGATMPSLNTSLMDNIPLNLPDLPTQQKIATVLSALDDKIELNNKINAELEAMAKTLYDYWFVQFEFPVDFESAKSAKNRLVAERSRGYKSSGGKLVYNPILKREIPEGWDVKRFGDLVKSINTGLNPRDHFKLGNGENFYITIKNIEYGIIKFDNSCDKIDDDSMRRIQKRSNLEKGDILFTSIEPVGKTYLLHENPKNWNINESVFSLKPNLELLSSEYLFMLASSDEMKFKCKNSSTGSIHKGIRITPLKEFSFCYPPLYLIDKFTKKIGSILSRIDLNQKQNQELTQLRDWLLPTLMNGQVKVSDVYEK